MTTANLQNKLLLENIKRGDAEVKRLKKASETLKNALEKAE